MGSPSPLADSGQFFAAAPRLAVDADGDFVVTGDGGNNQVLAQRFARGGGKLGTNFLVGSIATTTLTLRASPDVASDAQGNFVIIWDAYSSDGTQDIQARLYRGP